MSRLALAALCLAVGLSAQAFAKADLPVMTFGPEFTFGTGLVPDARAKVVARQSNHLVLNQPDGAKFTRDHFHFLSPNGWWFDVSSDPGVIEVHMSPQTTEFFRRFKDDMQDAIFVSAANEGCFPQTFLGGGHINIGLQGFDGHDLLLRNFIVDLYNHNELFMGIFNYDTNNALPYGLFDEDTHQAILRVIAKHDQGEYSYGQRGQMKFLADLDAATTHTSDAFRNLWSPGAHRGKNVAVSLTNADIGPHSRIELRGVRPQASMDVWVHQIELLQARIRYLNQFKEPIPLKLAVPIVQPLRVDFENHGLRPPVAPREALAAFHLYILEAGQKWRDHRDYVWPEWISSGHVTAYERSLPFHVLETRFKIRRKCERYLITAE